MDGNIATRPCSLMSGTAEEQRVIRVSENLSERQFESPIYNGMKSKGLEQKELIESQHDVHEKLTSQPSQIDDVILAESDMAEYEIMAEMQKQTAASQLNSQHDNALLAESDIADYEVIAEMQRLRSQGHGMELQYDDDEPDADMDDYDAYLAERRRFESEQDDLMPPDVYEEQGIENEARIQLHSERATLADEKRVNARKASTLPSDSSPQPQVKKHKSDSVAHNLLEDAYGNLNEAYAHAEGSVSGAATTAVASASVSLSEHWRPRILAMDVFGECISVTSVSSGSRVYCQKDCREVYDESLMRGPSTRNPSFQRNFQLLERPIATLLRDLDDERLANTIAESERISHELRRSVSGLEDMNNEIDERKIRVRAKLDLEPQGILEDSGHADKESLWVAKYAPRNFLNLLSDEATNRELTRWVKAWEKGGPPVSAACDEKGVGAKHQESGAERVVLMAGPPGETRYIHRFDMYGLVTHT
jgi:hypothetical protein